MDGTQYAEVDDRTEFTLFESKRNVNTFAEESIQGCTAVEIIPKV